MKTFPFPIFSIPCVILLSGILGGVPLEAAPRPATVLSGNVIVKRKNVSTASAVGGGLRAGDIVATSANSSASLQFSDGSKVSMSGGSAIEITNPGKNKTLMRALNGRVAANLKSGQTIATRSAMIRVKGTEIIITIAPDGATTLEVIEGSAEFFSPCGKVLVQRGERSEAKPGTAPSTPTQIPNLDDLLKEWQTKGIEFEITPDAPRLMPRVARVQMASANVEQKETVTLVVADAPQTDAPQVVVKPVAITETKSQKPPPSTESVKVENQ